MVEDEHPMGRKHQVCRSGWPSFGILKPTIHRTIPFFGMFGFIVLALASSSSAQDLGVIGLFPPGAAPGESIDVNCRGKAAVWPVEIWTDRDGISGASLEEQGKIKLEIASDAKPGVYWIRLHSTNHVSKLLPFYIDRIPSALEKEPNNRVSEATEITSVAAVMGRLEKTDEVDTFGLTLEANEKITAAVIGHRPLGSPMDAVLQVCNERGQVLDQNDDSRGVDPQLTFEAPERGKYYLRLFAFPETPTSSVRFAGGETFVYRLEVSTEDRFELPIQDADSALQVIEDPNTETKLYFRDDRLGFVDATTPAALMGDIGVSSTVVSSGEPLHIPDVRWGQIKERDGINHYPLDLEKDQNVRIVVESRPFLMELDPLLVVRRADGSKAAENDDFNKQRKAQLDFKAPETETYFLDVSDASGRGGERFGYRITVQPIEPSYEVFATNHFMQLAPGETVEFVVNIIRANGFEKPIRIEAKGILDGIECEPVESLMGTDTEKKVTLKFLAAEEFAGHPIQILAQSPDDRTQLAHFLSGVGTSRHALLWCLPKPTQ